MPQTGLEGAVSDPGAASAAAVNRGVNLARTAIGQSRAADQLIPDLVATARPEFHVQRDFLGIGIGTAEAVKVATACFRCGIGIPGPHDGLPQRTLERLIVVIETVLPFQERRFRGRQFFAVKFDAHGSSISTGPGAACTTPAGRQYHGRRISWSLRSGLAGLTARVGEVRQRGTGGTARGEGRVVRGEGRMKKR